MPGRSCQDIITAALLILGLAASVGYLLGAVDPESLDGLAGTLVEPGRAVIARVRDTISAPPRKVFSAAELAHFDGSDPSKPLLLCILGEVFDVTAGEKHYKKGSGYNIFLGQDSSKAFHTGDFATPVEDVSDLQPMQLLDVTGWREFYRQHATYFFVGVLAGRYYGPDGQPTPALHTIDARAAAAKEISAREQQLQASLPTCSMAYSGDTKMTTITCSANTAGEPRQPRLITWKHSGTGKDVSRCVCLTRRETVEGLPQLQAAHIAEYQGCDPFAPQCIKKFY